MQSFYSQWRWPFRLALASLASLTLVSAVPAATPIKLTPAEESIRDPELARTLRELLLITGRKDKAALLSYIDPTIRCSFGGCAGPQQFSTFWKLDKDPARSAVWGVLEDMLLLGGAYDSQGSGIYYVPYVFARFPESRDAFEYMAVTGKDVQLRTAPKLDASVVTTLSYDIVKRLNVAKLPSQTLNGRSYPWLKVQLDDGRSGYVLSRYAYSPVAYRIGLSKKTTGWKIDFFVAGD